jgi:hypothetical protein
MPLLGTSASQNTKTFLAVAPTPNTPTVVDSAAVRSSGLRVSFTPNAAFNSYTITSSPGGYTATGSSSPLTAVGNYNPNTNYTFTITATNSSTGLTRTSEASNSVTTPAESTINSYSTLVGSSVRWTLETPQCCNCDDLSLAYFDDFYQDTTVTNYRTTTGGTRFQLGCRPYGYCTTAC